MEDIKCDVCGNVMHYYKGKNMYVCTSSYCENKHKYDRLFVEFFCKFCGCEMHRNSEEWLYKLECTNPMCNACTNKYGDDEEDWGQPYDEGYRPQIFSPSNLTWCSKLKYELALKRWLNKC